MKISYAKAGNLDMMRKLTREGKYPEKMTVEDSFKDVLHNICKEEVTPLIVFGTSMAKSKINNGDMVVTQKKRIEELKEHDVIALEMPIKNDRNEVKLRLFNSIKDTILSVDKYEPSPKDGELEIKPSSNTHKLDSYIGVVIKVFNTKKMKKMIVQNTPKLKMEVTDNNGLYKSMFKNLDYFTDNLDHIRSKKDLTLITGFFQGYGESRKLAKENLSNRMKNLIENNELNRENSVISKTLTQLKYYF